MNIIIIKSNKYLIMLLYQKFSNDTNVHKWQRHHV